MSYILDALKKIEREKNNKRSDGRISIAGDMFLERKHPASRVVLWKIVVLIIVASLITCAGTWYMLQGNSKKNVAVTRPVASPAAVPIMPVPQPTAVSVRPAIAPAASKGKEAVENDESSLQEARRSKKQIKIQSVTPKRVVQTVQAPADIKLSGIAWQDERAARRAVINGFLLKEGAVVSGAKITDIQADRVRFSSSAGLFEIKLDAVLPAEVK